MKASTQAASQNTKMKGLILENLVYVDVGINQMGSKKGQANFAIFPFILLFFPAFSLGVWCSRRGVCPFSGEPHLP